MMDDEEREALEKIRAGERRADWVYAGILIGGLVVVLLVVLLVALG